MVVNIKVNPICGHHKSIVWSRSR